MSAAKKIARYEPLPAAYNAYDPGAIATAQAVKALIEGALPDTLAEHIGSTAIPGCAGKGIVDLMVLYPAGRIAATRDGLEALGFQRQQSGHVFPEERPMRVGAIDHNGHRYRLHVHVIAVDSPEAQSMRAFRDLLCQDDSLRVAYEARKRAILHAGVSEAAKYTEAKSIFISELLTRAAMAGWGTSDLAT